LALYQSKLTSYPDGRHSDGGNLYLYVKGGGRSFMYRSNKYREGLGGVDVCTLAEAREKAAAIRKLEHEGKDPKVERRAARLDQDRAKITFRQVAEDFVETRLAHKQPSTIKQYRMWLRIHILPKIGDMLTGEITRDDILEDHGIGLMSMWSKKYPTAHRVRHLVECILDFAEYRDYPVRLYKKGKNAAAWKDGLDNILAAKKEVHTVKHHQGPSHEDAPRFLAALRSHKSRGPNSNTTMPLLIECVLMTAVRRDEAVRATLEEFDLQRMVWTIPSGRYGHLKRKDEREVPREVPITRVMVDLIKRRDKKCIEMGIDPLDQNAPMFPSWRGGPLCPSSCVQFLSKTLDWEGKVTVHGLRDTFKNWSRAADYSEVLSEIQLDHELGEQIGLSSTELGRAYGRNRLLDKRRVMMEHYCDYLDGATPAAGANVTQINEARKRRRSA
jgi:integrase